MSLWSKVLRTNDDSTIPGTILCVHVATVATPDASNPRKRIHRLRCGYAIAGRMEGGQWTREKFLRFNSGAELISWMNFVRQSQKPLWLIAHKLSHILTLIGFWDGLESCEFTMSQPTPKNLDKVKSPRLRRIMERQRPGLLIEADPPTALVCWHRDGWKVIALETRNYWDKSLSQLATLAGIPEPRQPHTDAEPEAFFAYCEQASRVVQQCMTRLAAWHARNDHGNWSFTVSGMALSTLRHKYYRDTIHCPDDINDREFERRAYYNGRTEAFWLGEIRSGRFYPFEGERKAPTLTEQPPRGPFYLVDSRSFYGAVQTFQSVPVKCEAEGDGWPPGDIFPKRLDENYLAEVRIISDRHEFPVRINNHTVFATGDFWTVLCGPELYRAVSAGCVHSVGHWRRYAIETALRSFGLGMWDRRLEAEQAGDQLLAALSKGIIARLHGKFMQRDVRWTVVKNVIPEGPWRHWSKVNHTTGEIKHYRSIGRSVQVQCDAGDMPHCFPALAAWVTAWGREYLRHWMALAGSRQVLLCSTDSLLVTQEGKCNLEKAGIVAEDGIGACRVVTSCGDVTVYGPNHYRLADKFTFAGLPLDSWPASRTSAGYTTSVSLRRTLAHKPPESITETDQVASIRLETDSRRLTPGGWLDRIVLEKDSPTWTSVPTEHLTSKH